uniref:Transposase IS66 zinc-finger binding domain-containing protein n=1 Tax=Schlesneria paludicola TaxID=360056 RepID=A0A7C4QQ90_9PLAN
MQVRIIGAPAVVADPQDFDNAVVEPRCRLAGKQAQRFLSVLEGGGHDGHLATDSAEGHGGHQSKTTFQLQRPGSKKRGPPAPGLRPSGDDPAPGRHQVWELSEIQPIVTKYQRHRLACPCCGETTCGELPPGGPARRS